MKNQIHKIAHIYRHYHLLSDHGKNGYVGQTITSIELRWFEHCQSARLMNRNDSNTLFKRAIRKHGEESFKSEILEVLKDVTKEEINNREKYWIKYYDTFDSGYNMTIGGDGRITWGYYQIMEDSKKYKSRTEYKEKSPSSYGAAKRLGVFEESCSHMPKRGDLCRKWDYDSIKEECLKYKNRTELRKHSDGCYMAALDLGIINDVCSHMKRTINWDKERIEELWNLAISFDDMKSFTKAHPKYYKVACRLKLVEDIKKVMISKKGCL